MSQFEKKVINRIIKNNVDSMNLAIPDKYSHIDFTPPKGVQVNAQRALNNRAKKPASQRGMTPIGIARARDLINAKQISPDTIRRMLAYFTRHEVDKQGSTWADYGKGRQAWDGWGGDEGYTWAKKVVNQMNDADEKSKSLAEIPDKYLKGAPYGTKGDREEEIKNRKDDKNTDYSPLPGDEKGTTRESKYSKTEFAKKVKDEMTDNSTQEFLRVASKISDISKSILEEVHRRGAEAWATSGHRVGASQIAWARARVYSFVTGGKTRDTADKDLWEKHKKKSLSEASIEGISKALIKGRPFLTLALGKVNSRMDGSEIGTVTLKDLEEMVRVFYERKDTDPVIIDWNHATSLFSNQIASPDAGIAFGQIADLELKDGGLYAYPLYTSKGAKIVEESEGNLWSSPEFILGPVYAKDGGHKVGDAQLLAITLTPRPAQAQNKIDRILLSENVNMDQQELMQKSPEELVNLVLEKDALVKQLEAKLASIEAEMEASQSEESLDLAEDKKAEDKASEMKEDKYKAMSETSQKLLNEMSTRIAALNEQVNKLSQEKHNAERKNAIDALLNTGKISPAEKAVCEKAFDLKDKDSAFWNMFSERKPNQAVNLGEVGHNSASKPMSLSERVDEIKKQKGITFAQALDLFIKDNPTEYQSFFGV